MPDHVEMRLMIPAELGPEAEVLDELRHRVDAAVAAIVAERLRNGRRVLGRRAVLHQPRIFVTDVTVGRLRQDGENVLAIRIRYDVISTNAPDNNVILSSIDQTVRV
jgi:hypothetical protein